MYERSEITGFRRVYFVGQKAKKRSVLMIPGQQVHNIVLHNILTDISIHYTYYSMVYRSHYIQNGSWIFETSASGSCLNGSGSVQTDANRIVIHMLQYPDFQPDTDTVIVFNIILNGSGSGSSTLFSTDTDANPSIQNQIKRIRIRLVNFI